MTKINNGLSRNLIIKRPRDGNSPVILTHKTLATGDITIPPFGSAEVDFWDKVKGHPVYQNLLDRKLITVGNERPDKSDFTSAGDTLKAPASLDPDSVKDEATAEGVKNLAYEQEPAIATKRRGRPAKTEAEAEGGDDPK